MSSESEQASLDKTTAVKHPVTEQEAPTPNADTQPSAATHLNAEPADQTEIIDDLAKQIEAGKPTPQNTANVDDSEAQEIAESLVSLEVETIEAIEADPQPIVIDAEFTPEISDVNKTPENIEDAVIIETATETVDIVIADTEVVADDTPQQTETEDAPKVGRKARIMAAIPSVGTVSMPKMNVSRETMAKVSFEKFEQGAESWIGKLPESVRPFAKLARLDKPVGFLLLALPCWIGLAFARIETGMKIWDPYWLVLFTIGAVLMRSAGCVWNDINDRDIDAQVERTKNRPLPSGDIKLTQAFGFLAVLLFFALVIWLALPTYAKFVALAAIPLVAAYPFMKTITWWPQAWLGLTFSWGVLLSAAVAGFSAGTMPLYLAMVCWVIAYDTIYSMQDADDDALIGVRSTARLFGDFAALGALGFHIAAAILIYVAAFLQGAETIGLLLMVVFAAHGIWQSWRVEQTDGADALDAFKSNVQVGLIVFLGFLLAAFWETIWGGLTSLF